MDDFFNVISVLLYSNISTWRERIEIWVFLVSQMIPLGFVKSNADMISRVLNDREGGIRAVINIPADALLRFLQDKNKKYLNIYDRPKVNGKERGPSQDRIKVDEMLGLKGKREDYYFAAAALGGAGVRFYGDYCMVLKPEVIKDSTRVLDRNSYDLIRPPWDQVSDTSALVEVLGGTWGVDLIDIVKSKVLPAILHKFQAVTMGTVSDLILHDEEFIEVYKHGAFGPDDLEEIRQAPEECSLQADLERRYEGGLLPRAEELLWINRRRQVERELSKKGIRLRVVTNSGRGKRWR